MSKTTTYLIAAGLAGFGLYLFIKGRQGGASAPPALTPAQLKNERDVLSGATPVGFV
jgi:hypothetical protein